MTIVAEIAFDATRKITLKHGVKYDGKIHRDAVVGPLTNQAEMAALLDQPDGIDSELLGLYARHKASDDDLKKYDIVRPELTKKQISRAKNMEGAQRLHQARFRLVSLGTIPHEDIPQAFDQLLPADVAAVLKVAREVDDFVDSFRHEDVAGVGESVAPREVRPADSELAFESDDAGGDA